MMLSCRQAARLVSQGLDRRLAPGERLRLRLHLVICEGCRRLQAQMQFLQRAVQRLADAE